MCRNLNQPSDDRNNQGPGHNLRNLVKWPQIWLKSNTLGFAHHWAASNTLECVLAPNPHLKFSSALGHHRSKWQRMFTVVVRHLSEPYNVLQHSTFWNEWISLRHFREESGIKWLFAQCISFLITWIFFKIGLLHNFKTFICKWFVAWVFNFLSHHFTGLWKCCGCSGMCFYIPTGTWSS